MSGHNGDNQAAFLRSPAVPIAGRSPAVSIAGRSPPPTSPGGGRSARGHVRNVMTIDLEEWFHVTNFAGVLKREDWSSYPTRIQYTLPRLLDIFEQYNTQATFFTLGWVARRFPKLIRRIAEAGHELASHGDEHQVLTTQSPTEFRGQLLRSRDAIEQTGRRRIFGHRAPTYSFRKTTEWAIPILLEEGFQYDSSVFPFGARRDPRLCDARFPCFLQDHGAGQLVEYPLSTFRIGGQNIPVAGGGYFRLLPYRVIRWAIESLNREGHRAIMYLHPWEIDPDQPRIAEASWLARFRHYHQLDRTESKLRRLLGDFTFGSIRDVFWSPGMQRYDIVAQ